MNHQTQNPKPATPLQVRKGVQKYASNLNITEITSRNDGETDEQYQKRCNSLKGALRGKLASIIKKTMVEYQDKKNIDLGPQVDLYRRLIFSWLLTEPFYEFEDRSTSDYLPREWVGIKKWIGSKKVNGVWCERPTFEEEVLQVLYCVKEDYAELLKGNKQFMGKIIEKWEQVFSGVQSDKESVVEYAESLGGNVGPSPVEQVIETAAQIAEVEKQAEKLEEEHIENLSDLKCRCVLLPVDEEQEPEQFPYKESSAVQAELFEDDGGVLPDWKVFDS